MTEGYFLNINTGKAYPVRNHEMAIREKEFATKIGIKDSLFQQFPEYEPVKDREAFLRWILSKVPIIRVRGYGVWVGIQWGCGSDKQAFEAIRKWGRKVCGPCLMLRMCNIKTGKQYNSFWLLFESTKAGKCFKSVQVEVTK